MSIWLCRAGRNGQYEARFLEDNKIFYTFEEIAIPLSSFGSKKDLQEYFLQVTPTIKENAASVYSKQGWTFFESMKPGDWVITPSKTAPGILHFGEISGDYVFDGNEDEDYRHSRSVNWFSDLRRDLFEADIQAVFNAPMTIYNVKYVERIRKVVEKSSSSINEQPFTPPPKNLEIESLDEISDFIIGNYKGDALERIIEAILKAKGFSVYHSPKGADHGVDLLASSGALGFGNPKICVQVKATESAIEREVLDRLIGTMANVGAEYGLLVSWSGFKKTILQDQNTQFFKVRLWSRVDILNELLSCYDLLDDEIKEEIPLKKIWVLDNKEDSEK